MFVAMNRFKVVKGHETAFEDVWKGRDTKLGEMKGFLDFHLLRGPEAEITLSMRLTRSGRTARTLKPGPSRSSFATPIRTLGRTRCSTRGTRSSKAFPRSRELDHAIGAGPSADLKRLMIGAVPAPPPHDGAFGKSSRSKRDWESDVYL